MKITWADLGILLFTFVSGMLIRLLDTVESEKPLTVGQIHTDLELTASTRHVQQRLRRLESLGFVVRVGYRAVVSRSQFRTNGRRAKAR